MRINVIIPSFLGDYPNAANDRVMKFHRAYRSFFDQDYNDKILFIVSDNCSITTKAIINISESWPKYEKHRTLYMELGKKQVQFSGEVRNYALRHFRKQAMGGPDSIVCYLDTDDVLKPNHLSLIADAFKNDPYLDWVYFNDLVATDTSVNYRVRSNEMKFGRIGTSAIAHRTSCDVKWQDGYGHDWKFIEDLFAKYPNFKHAGQNGYVVCHIPGQIDF